MAETHKKTVQPNKQALLNRLKRVEGQVRGLHRMIDEDKYCVDILHQISAVESALKNVSLVLMEDHAKHCMVKAIQNGNQEETIEELMDIIKRMK
ncbi:metal-sensitive transcriptional regulator [Aureibacillus halotolerans]|uniref:DNA-binding FrmR family transcriptional regulator n=1 Tax=Aureibacillus halotolerans TaxID=1508390 RepID=A0A4R6TT47_9BACI|nr:metal-sensitive transcriptional regulator [Aureibacillus halotolerans]TDQ36266.1 DNA-binding FrmR family transcriptional regulator [Aureibacillus halotolerans]